MAKANPVKCRPFAEIFSVAIKIVLITNDSWAVEGKDLKRKGQRREGGTQEMRQAGLPWHQPSCWGDSWLLQRGRTTHPQMEEYTSYTFRWPQLFNSAYRCTCTAMHACIAHKVTYSSKLSRLKKKKLNMQTTNGVSTLISPHVVPFSTLKGRKEKKEISGQISALPTKKKTTPPSIL